MENIHFPKPRRFDVFKMMYVERAKRTHHDNSHWQTFAQVYENLGGYDCIYDVFSAFEQVSRESQKRLIGFTDVDIDAFLEDDNAGKLYAEAIAK